MRRLVFGVALASMVAASAPSLFGFCGFYVSKADTKLFNKASQVVLVRQDDKTVLTMANDFKGDPREFAIVVPVPTVLEKDQIHVGDKALLDHLDAYSAPRLVEYFDGNPCVRTRDEVLRLPSASAAIGGLASGGGRALPQRRDDTEAQQQVVQLTRHPRRRGAELQMHTLIAERDAPVTREECAHESS